MGMPRNGGIDPHQSSKVTTGNNELITMHFYVPLPRRQGAMSGRFAGQAFMDATVPYNTCCRHWEDKVSNFHGRPRGYMVHVDELRNEIFLTVWSTILIRSCSRILNNLPPRDAMH